MNGDGILNPRALSSTPILSSRFRTRRSSCASCMCSQRSRWSSWRTWTQLPAPSYCTIVWTCWVSPAPACTSNSSPQLVRTCKSTEVEEKTIHLKNRSVQKLRFSSGFSSKTLTSISDRPSPSYLSLSQSPPLWCWQLVVSPLPTSTSASQRQSAWWSTIPPTWVITPGS